MSEQKPQIVHNIPVFGIFLLFLGIVFLLQTLNVLPWGLWGTLWRFWPVLLIVAGISILLRRYNSWLISALILVLLFAGLGIAIWQHGLSLPAGDTAKSFSLPLNNLESAQIQIDFTAGSLTIGSLPAASSNFVEANSGMRNGDMRISFQQQGSEGILHLITEQTGRRFWDEDESSWDIRLTRNIPLTLEVKSAVVNLELDLSELKVTNLQMDIDAGNYLVQMPSAAGVTYATIKANITNLELTIPENVAAKIKIESALATVEVDESRFPKRGDYYISPDFENTLNRVELELDCGIGRVRLK